METKTMTRGGIGGKVAAAAVVILLLPLAYSVVWFALSLGATGAEPFLASPDTAQGDRCIIRSAYQLNPRFHHMVLLKQLRNEAVREGIRGEVGFGTCQQCHTSKEQFCNQCHRAVNLNVDCYRCHYYP